MRVFLAILFAFFYFADQAQAEEVDRHPSRVKQVLVLHSFGIEHPWDQKIQEGIREYLAKNDQSGILVREESLDAFGTHLKNYQPTFTQYLKQKYQSGPDVIVAVEEEALRFLRENLSHLWPQVPIVFSGIGSFQDTMIEGFSSVSGVFERHNFSATLNLAQQLHPKVRQFVFLLDDHPRGKILKGIIEELVPRYPGIHFLSIQNPNLSEIKKLSKYWDSESVVFVMTPYILDGKNIFSFFSGLNSLSQNFPFPLYSFWDYFLGNGIVGGKLVSGTEQGELAAKICLSILKGASANNIPFLKGSEGEFGFDATKLKEKKLVLDQLPKEKKLENFSFQVVSRTEMGILIFGFIILLFTFIIVFTVFLNKDRKRMLLKIQESRGRLNSLMSNIPDLVIFRIQTQYPQRILFVSEGIKKMTGHPLKEISELMRIVHPEDQSIVKAEREKQLLSSSTVELEYRVLCRDQRTKYVREKSCLAQADEGLVLDGVLIDVTQIKLLEREKTQMQNQLFQSSRLASMGTLAAGVAHEINNPLAIVQGYFDIVRKTLDKRDQLDKNLKEYFENGIQSLNRISNIVSSLKLFAKTGTEQHGPVNLHKIIEETANFCRPIFEKLNIQIVTKLEASFCIVHGNEIKLQQVMMSLINNSKDAILDSEQKLSGKIEISTFLLDGNLTLRVIDNGKGISSELIQKAFDPFFTTKAPGKGVGLGLSIAHSIIELIGGSIVLQSIEGKSTTVVITLPLSLSISQGEHLKKILPQEEGAIIAKGSCLIIDDESGLRRVLKDYLENFGLSVDEASDGEAGFELLKRKTYDYLFLDHFMPKMDGIEFLKITKGHPHLLKTKCFFMTGGFLDEQVDSEVKDSIHGRLSKPFTEADLRQLLKITSEFR